LGYPGLLARRVGGAKQRCPEEDGAGSREGEGITVEEICSSPFLLAK
jgi:hypothetical protein